MLTFASSLVVVLATFSAAIPADTPPTPAPATARTATPIPPRLLEGVVVDLTGQVVPGATVVLNDPGMPAVETTTGPAGTFVFTANVSDAATVSAVLPGFSPVTIPVSATSSLRIVLQPAGVSETVQVRGAIERRSTATATRTDTPLRDIPQAVSIVSRDTIAAAGMQNMADVVRFVPGAGMAQGEGNRDTPILRGNASTGDFFQDGIRDDVQYYRDLYNVERVEILTGPNATTFGRGGSGGIVNRVSRVASWRRTSEASLQAGSFGDRRAMVDLGGGLSRRVAARLTGMYERSDSFRSGAHLERTGVNPTVALSLGARTLVTGGYERFHDDRTADRGIPSHRGAPIDTPRSTFFGDANASRATVTVDAWTLALEHRTAGGVVVRSRVRHGVYDKFYRNVYPGAVNAAGTSVSVSGYDHGTARRNLFTQTDVVLPFTTGRLRHTLLVGAEAGTQRTSNDRTTAYFGNAGDRTSIDVPVNAPQAPGPIVFRQSATDADNDSTADLAAAYVQDQVEIGRRVQATVGLRLEALSVQLVNNRTSSELRSDDRLLAPRFGIVYRAARTGSIYASYGMSYQPRAGEQLASLTLANQALEPERFTNYEVGTKWDVAAVSATAAVYRLNRENVAVADPGDPSRLVLVDGQRASGFELSVTGSPVRAWSVIASYAHQRGSIIHSLSPTARAGATLAQLPAHGWSVWNRCDLTRRLGVAGGVLFRGEVFTSTDNTVTLPAYVRVDGAVYFTVSGRLRGQVNVENALNRRYYASANGNNNISPGSPRAARLVLTTTF